MTTSAWIRATVALSGVSFLLSGCATSSSASPNVVDMKNIVLSNLSGDCADYSASYQAAVTDVKRDMPFVSEFKVSGDGTTCAVSANDIPNYDFNDQSAHFAEPVAEQIVSLSIPRNPVPAPSTSELSMLTYNAVMLNGVVLDQIANGCYKPDDPAADRDGNIANGCGPSVDWRLDPMGPVSFGTDSHNGHTQPGGLYHYHGNPYALFDPEETDQGSPVIGFAADGFPIYGPHYIDPATGSMREAISGYTLKHGERPAGDNSPGGSYDGTYIQDYEFTNAGTLDKCNGMTVNGQYGYYVTSSYPYVMGCYRGTPNASFCKFSDVTKLVIPGALALLATLTGITVWLTQRRRNRKTSSHAPATNKKAVS